MNDIRYLVGIAIAVGVTFALIYNFAFAGTNNIFLVNGNNQTPTACSGNTGLVLAQNLTDLCDVTIISPQTGQIIDYNGSQWVNVNQVVFNDTTQCNNIGIGSAFACVEGTNVHLRSILASTGLSVTNNTNTITITNTEPESTVCSGHTGSYNLVESSISGNCAFKNLLSGSGISMSDNGTHIIISNTGIISLNCVHGIVCSGTNPALINGSSLQNQETTVCSSAGGTTYVKSSTGGNCQLYGGTAGVGLTLTQNTNDNQYKTNFANGTGISITGTGQQTFTNTGVISNSCTAPIVCSGTNPSAISYADSPYWQMLCHNTGSGSTVSCSSFTGKKQLFIQISFNVSSSGTAIVPALQFNSDAGSNYAWRNSFNGGADSTGTSSSSCAVIGSNTVGTSGGGTITISAVNNFSNLRKLLYIQESHGLESNSGTAPTHAETGCKWSNTSAQITTITLLASSGTATYSTGTIITVWGHD